MHSSLLIGVALFFMGFVELLDMSSLPVFFLASGVNILWSGMVVVNLNFVTDQTSSGVILTELVVPWGTFIESIYIVILNLFWRVKLFVNSDLITFPFINPRNINILPVIGLTSWIVAWGSQTHTGFGHTSPFLLLFILILIPLIRILLSLVSEIFGVSFRRIFRQNYFSGSLSPIPILLRNQRFRISISLGMREMSCF